MQEYSFREETGMRHFENPDGTVWYFGDGAHLRTWKAGSLKAHDVWVARAEAGILRHSDRDHARFR